MKPLQQSRNFLALGALLVLGCGMVSPAHSQDQHEYQPEPKVVIYKHSVPNSIQRIAKKVGPTRFYGSFQQGQKKFAVHFYDTSKVMGKEQAFLRNSRLDVFELTNKNTWHLIQAFPLTRQVGQRKDSIYVVTQVLWLDPARKTIPLIFLKTSEGYGKRTSIYGVLQKQPNPKAFLSLDGDSPESPTTTTSSRISFPDDQGNLTVLYTTSDPGSSAEGAYRWTGQNWKMVATAQFENGWETAKYWNGTEYVPYDNSKP